MPELVFMGAMLKCSEGAAPTPLIVTANQIVNGNGLLAATVQDHVPGVNVIPFGACGKLKPPVCAPALAEPWDRGSEIFEIAGSKALTKECKLKCAVGGEITIISPAPGQPTVSIES